MAKLSIGDHGVYINDHRVRAITQVHLDLDAVNNRAHVSLILDLTQADVSVDLLEAQIWMVNNENPRVMVRPDHLITESRP